LCTSKNSSFKERYSLREKILDRDFTREHLLETYPTAKTFPVIVVDGFYIGGYTQLAEKLNEELNKPQILLNE